jgi:hypothetical protein
MKLYYDSPEARARQNAAATLKESCDSQMKLLAKMRTGDGRTTEFRKMSERSTELESLIQECIARIINPEAEQKAA